MTILSPPPTHLQQKDFLNTLEDKQSNLSHCWSGTERKTLYKSLRCIFPSRPKVSIVFPSVLAHAFIASFGLAFWKPPSLSLFRYPRSTYRLSFIQEAMTLLPCIIISCLMFICFLVSGCGEAGNWFNCSCHSLVHVLLFNPLFSKPFQCAQNMG